MQKQPLDGEIRWDWFPGNNMPGQDNLERLGTEPIIEINIVGNRLVTLEKNPLYRQEVAGISPKRAIGAVDLEQPPDFGNYLRPFSSSYLPFLPIDQ
jgi:hypothetical protein